MNLWLRVAILSSFLLIGGSAFSRFKPKPEFKKTDECFAEVMAAVQTAATAAATAPYPPYNFKPEGWIYDYEKCYLSEDETKFYAKEWDQVCVGMTGEDIGKLEDGRSAAELETLLEDINTLMDPMEGGKGDQLRDDLSKGLFLLTTGVTSDADFATGQVERLYNMFEVSSKGVKYHLDAVDKAVSTIQASNQLRATSSEPGLTPEDITEIVNSECCSRAYKDKKPQVSPDIDMFQCNTVGTQVYREPV